MNFDPEQVVADYLRVQTGAAVVSKTPAEHSAPWIRYTLLDASDDGTKAAHLFAVFIQLDVYAGESNVRADVSALARSAREALKVMHKASHSNGGVVVTVTKTRINGFGRFPDADLEPARERYVVGFDCWMHS